MADSADLNQPPGKAPIAQEAYDQLAEAYAEKIATKPHNAYYERPAMLSLLPDVRGKHILDVGCGPGVYAEILVGIGAEVVAFDANPRVVDHARAWTRKRRWSWPAWRNPWTFWPMRLLTSSSPRW